MNTEKLRKYLLPNLLIFWFGNQLGEAYRLAVGGNLLQKIGGISKTLNKALTNPFPSFYPQDLAFGLAAAGGDYLRSGVLQKEKHQEVPQRRRARLGAMGHPGGQGPMSIPNRKTT